MNNTLSYKGYVGSVNFDADDRVFHGRVLGITGDVISFEGMSVEELERDFREAVDDYLDTCSELGKQPARPFSGEFRLRVPSELHAAIAAQAKHEGKSINTWIAEICERAVESA